MRKLDWHFHKPNECPFCHNSSIEMYNYFNYPMGYSNVVDAYIASQPPPAGVFNKQEIYTFRCKVCGKCYPLKWWNGFPLPDFHPQSEKEFMAMFKDCK